MYMPAADLDATAADLTEKIFTNIDKNKDGKLSMQEFVDGAEKDRTLISILEGVPLI